MTREDQRVFRRMAIAVGASLVGFVGVGALFLQLHPPDEVDAKCLNKPMTEIGRCIYDAAHPSKD